MNILFDKIMSKGKCCWLYVICIRKQLLALFLLLLLLAFPPSAIYPITECRNALKNGFRNRKTLNGVFGMVFLFFFAQPSRSHGESTSIHKTKAQKVSKKRAGKSQNNKEKKNDRKKSGTASMPKSITC